MKKTIIKFVAILCFIIFSNSIFAQRFSPTVDTYIDQKVPTTAQGSANGLVVRTTTGYNRVAFFEFNIADFSEQVSKAELCMYLYVANAANKTDTLEAYEVISGEISDAVTWDNFNGNYTLSDVPLAKIVVTTGATVSTAYGWYRFDIKGLINTLASTTGTDKKVKLAIKAKTTNLQLNFYSSNYAILPHFRPNLIMTPALPTGLVEKSRTTVAKDIFISSVDSTTSSNLKYIQTSYKKATPNEYTNSILRFNVPSVTLNDYSHVTIKTKVNSANCGTTMNYVVDLMGVNNLNNTTDIDILTWKTKPSDLTYLRSHFFSADDKTNETDIEWDVTSFVKAAQTAGKTYADFSLQIPDKGAADGNAIAFYSRNWLDLDPSLTTIPQMIYYDSPTTKIDNNSIDNRKVIVKGSTLIFSNTEALSGKIIDLRGKTINVFKSKTEVDISTLPKGLLMLVCENGKVYKFVK